MLARSLGARLVAIAFALGSGACDTAEAPAPAPPLAAPAPPPAPPEPPPTERSAASFASEDGAALSGDFYLAAPDAPAVVLVHRLFGDRSEFSPLVERLRRSQRRYSVLSFDLRGHGASEEPAQKAKQKRGDTKAELAGDVAAAIAQAIEKTGGRTRGVVLVGSSFGATLASMVCFDQPKVTALALISPGAAIRGLDLYRPYSEVRNLPTFIAGAEGDTVAKDPLDSLERMAQRATLKRYSGSRHGAQFLGQEHAALWADLEAWLDTVYDQKPEERRSLYYAPGKEPKARKRPGSPRAGGGS
jgi:pimeloyl-ACP methyl ester carboxylesterase